jgi:hypothetical protein
VEASSRSRRSSRGRAGGADGGDAVIVKVAVAATVALLALAGALIFIDPCDAPDVSVVNELGAPITDVAIAGVGFDESLGALGPGATVTRSVRCGGESGLTLSFTAAGERRAHDDLAYLEACGGYRVRLVIEPSGAVRASTAVGYP